MRKKISVFLYLFIIFSAGIVAQDGLVPEFKLEPNDITLTRIAKPGTPFDKVGRRFAILGEQSGSFEAWAYPLKLFRNFTFSFFLGSSTQPIEAKDIVRFISVAPEATTITYTYQSFTAKAIFITPIEEPGAIILLDIDSTEPLTIVCGFLPVLQPMWPAGLGGQFAYWDNSLKAYVISESSGKNHGIFGSPAAEGLSYTPAHMLSDAPNEFRIPIPDPQLVKHKFIPLYIAGGKGNRTDIIDVYKNLQINPKKYYLQNIKHFRDLQERTLQLKTPNHKLNLAYEWAKVSYDNLIVDNPALGKGMIAGLGVSGSSGRPGFGWFFGGDAYINSLSLSSYGEFQTVREILAFFQKWQRQDGKMAHELSQSEGYIDWWNDYPYGYIHADTTPYFIAAMYEYIKISGDIGFIHESWDSLKKAYDWCLSMDANEDGLMDNKKAGLGALEYGALTGIETDIYLAAIWTRATYAMQKLAEIVGQNSYASQAHNDFKKAKQAFHTKFWDKENQFYTYAFNTEGDQVQEISPWNAVGLMWDLGLPKESTKTLERLSSAELTTDWGVRSISIHSQHYEPLNYNYGAVWPFITSWVTSALYKHNMPLPAFTLLMSTASLTFENNLGGILEVFSGTHHLWPQESVSHQGFSTAGVTLPLIRGLLGLEGNAQKQTVTFAPQFPADWQKVEINNFKVGQAAISIDYKRNKDQILIKILPKNAQGYSLHLAPHLGLGTQIKSIQINGQNTDVQSRLEISIGQSPINVEMSISPSLEILPVITKSKIGDSNQGLKIIRAHQNNNIINMLVEGLSGQEYSLRIQNPEFIKEIQGATLKEGHIFIQIPTGQKGSFVKHSITITKK